MFNLGPTEIVVIALVGLIVLGPDKLPELARQAGRMLRTLRDMATGARSQLREELGPEFADVDWRDLDPRTAIQRAVLGDDVDLSKLNPRTFLQETFTGADGQNEPAGRVSLRKDAPAQQPRSGGEQVPYDTDAT